MLRSLCLFVVLLNALCIAPPAPCQTPDFVAALSGDKHPLTLKLKDLDGSWRGIHLPVPTRPPTRWKCTWRC